jgi:DNA-binding NarL/FixJ family response regulator
MSDVALDRRSAALGIFLFTVILIFIGWDLAEDYASGAHWLHVLVEFAVFVLASLGVFSLWRRFRAAAEATRLLERDLEKCQREARRWREDSRDCLDGLGAAIEKQFKRWELSPAEAEIGLLLLKGLSHKDIANVRQTSERTVRQQARALYLKAGLAGRAELSAFFLEDLLLPRDN